MMTEADLADILMQYWDPIGISGEPLAHDEYLPYIPTLLTLMNRSASSDIIASKLLEIEQIQMGLVGDQQRAQRVANLLISSSTTAS